MTTPHDKAIKALQHANKVGAYRLNWCGSDVAQERAEDAVKVLRDAKLKVCGICSTCSRFRRFTEIRTDRGRCDRTSDEVPEDGACWRWEDCLE